MLSLLSRNIQMRSYMLSVSLLPLALTYRASWPLTLLFLLLFSLISLCLHYWLAPGGFAWRNYRCNTTSMLKGPSGWPILGSIPEMGGLAHRKLASMAASFDAKRLMALSLGATPLIISSDPETAKEILSHPSFSDRPIKQSASLLMFERAIGFAPSGTYWRHLRRICANHMFSPKRISSLEGLRSCIVDDMLAEVGKEMDEKGFVELRGILRKGSMRNMIESVFGDHSICLQKQELLGEMVREGYELISTFNLEDHISLGFLDFYGVKRRCHKLALEVRSVLGEIVVARKREGGFRHGNDFLSALLSLPEEDRLSDSDMVAVLWEMIFRGADTVAILLEWIMARMILHPDIQAKAQEEMNTFLGPHRHVQDSDIPGLSYLQAIVKEVLRLHPPGPLLSWARLATRDVYVDKIFIPAGTTTMVNMWAITHDPSTWKDPQVFQPERFIENNMSIMGSDLRLAPFGSGRRVCPGRALGLSTVHLWLAQLLHTYMWFPEPKDNLVNLSECLKLSLEMKKPLTCMAVPHNLSVI